jgi:hypothetical protein
MNIENPHSFASRVAPIASAAHLLWTKDEDRNREHFKTEHLLTNLLGAHDLERGRHNVSPRRQSLR